MEPINIDSKEQHFELVEILADLAAVIGAHRKQLIGQGICEEAVDAMLMDTYRTLLKR